MRLLVILILSTYPFLGLAQQKKINCKSGGFITPPKHLSWEINSVFVLNGTYKITINDNIFPSYLLYDDTLHMPSWIAEQELLDAEEMDLNYLFIVTEKTVK